MNKIDKNGDINHGKYKIVCFTANSQKFYQARVKIKKGWWYSENFFDSLLDAGNEARDIIYA